MEIFSGPWFWALLAIIIMDLVLAGDNAIVIALAARSLPVNMQRKAILWGTAGAVIVRVLMTLVVAWLLKIEGLKLLGGLGLIWIAFNLLKPHDSHDDEANAKTVRNIGFMQAIKTIVIADALMGLDNVLAIAGAAKGDYSLIILGLLISIPIVVFGSTLVLKLIERHSWIIYVGAAIVVYTAVAMIATEPMIFTYLADIPTMVLYAIEIAIVIALVLLAKWFHRSKKAIA